jgi:hypothetical protein
MRVFDERMRAMCASKIKSVRRVPPLRSRDAAQFSRRDISAPRVALAPRCATLPVALAISQRPPKLNGNTMVPCKFWHALLFILQDIYYMYIILFIVCSKDCDINVYIPCYPKCIIQLNKSIDLQVSCLQAVIRNQIICPI